jgi:hypothetical protein
MKSRACGRRAPAYLAAVAASLPLAAHPAQAAPATGQVEFFYSAPRPTHSANRISWTWTVRNRGDRPAHQVMLTHTLTPKVRVASLSTPCLIVQGGAIKCDYKTLNPGARRSGTLAAAVPPELQRKVQISGYATWRQPPPPARTAPRSIQSSAAWASTLLTRA